MKYYNIINNSFKDRQYQVWDNNTNSSNSNSNHNNNSNGIIRVLTLQQHPDTIVTHTNNNGNNYIDHINSVNNKSNNSIHSLVYHPIQNHHQSIPYCNSSQHNHINHNNKVNNNNRIQKEMEMINGNTNPHGKLTSPIMVDILAPALTFPASLTQSEIINGTCLSLGLPEDQLEFLTIGDSHLCCLIKNSKFSLDFIESLYQENTLLQYRFDKSTEAVSALQETLLQTTHQLQEKQNLILQQHQTMTILSQKERQLAEELNQWKNKYEEELYKRKKNEKRIERMRMPKTTTTTPYLTTISASATGGGSAITSPTPIKPTSLMNSSSGSSCNNNSGNVNSNVNSNSNSNSNNSCSNNNNNNNSNSNGVQQQSIVELSPFLERDHLQQKPNNNHINGTGSGLTVSQIQNNLLNGHNNNSNNSNNTNIVSQLTPLTSPVNHNNNSSTNNITPIKFNLPNTFTSSSVNNTPVAAVVQDTKISTPTSQPPSTPQTPQQQTTVISTASCNKSNRIINTPSQEDLKKRVTSETVTVVQDTKISTPTSQPPSTPQTPQQPSQQQQPSLGIPTTITTTIISQSQQQQQSPIKFPIVKKINTLTSSTSLQDIKSTANMTTSPYKFTPTHLNHSHNSNSSNSSSGGSSHQDIFANCRQCQCSSFKATPNAMWMCECGHFGIKHAMSTSQSPRSNRSSSIGSPSETTSRI